MLEITHKYEWDSSKECHSHGKEIRSVGEDHLLGKLVKTNGKRKLVCSVNDTPILYICDLCCREADGWNEF